MSAFQQPDPYEGITIEELLDRIRNWDGVDHKELTEISHIIQRAYNGDSEEAVRRCCQCILRKFPYALPSFPKAKFYAYLAACPAYEEYSMLTIAFDWIQRARISMRDIGVVIEEIEEWYAIIKADLDEEVRKQKEPVYLPRPNPPLLASPFDASEDDDDDMSILTSHQGEQEIETAVDHLVQEAATPTTADKVADRKAAHQLAVDRMAAEGKETAKTRKEYGKQPKSFRLSAANQSFSEGSGRYGSLSKGSRKAVMAIRAGGRSLSNLFSKADAEVISRGAGEGESNKST
ncbi:uncharacterized protein LTR77_009098 [Saxophila tyrrhenica]|uniref:Uncharacterized protein n=1 Tax=Saxophila tyrrhenica TaxID=1690608 RepID=A0AAV9P3B3_9PEZI|nr:hypothetical protein LTR77_009098 [Saxophila tyrrhenica]